MLGSSDRQMVFHGSIEVNLTKDVPSMVCSIYGMNYHSQQRRPKLYMNCITGLAKLEREWELEIQKEISNKINRSQCFMHLHDIMVV